MVRTALVALCALYLVSAAVVKLTPETFDTIVDGSKHVFVEFYAPWCGHCKHLAPEYEIVGESFEKTASVVVASVDADAHKELGNRFGVSGYPTLKFFKKGGSLTEPSDYNGGRTASDIVAFLNKEAGTRAQVKKAAEAVLDLTPENFDKHVKDPANFALVEFFAPWCGHCKSLAPEYEKVAKAFKNEPTCVVAKVDADGHKDLGHQYGVSGYPTIKYFTKEDKSGDLKYEGARKAEDILKWLNEKCGTDRTMSGTLGPTAGRIAELDDIVASFVGGDHAGSLKKAEEFVASYSGAESKNAAYYVSVMKKVQEKADFAAVEAERLDRLVSTGSVAGTKVDEFTKKSNVLKVFAKA